MENGQFIPNYDYSQQNFNIQPQQKPKSIWLGLTSMILGIISLVICCVTIVSIILGVVALTLGLISLIKNKGGKGFAIAGVSTSAVALIFGLLMLYGETLPDDVDEPNKNYHTTNSQDDKTNNNGADNKTTDEQETTEQETTTVATPSNVFKAGQTVKTDDFKITFISCELYTDYKSYQEPDDGYVYYRFEFEFENISKYDQSVTSWDFECYADDYAVEDSYVGDDILSASLSSGKKTKGALYYIVPENAKKIELEYEVDYWRDKKIIFIAE